MEKQIHGIGAGFTPAPAARNLFSSMRARAPARIDGSVPSPSREQSDNPHKKSGALGFDSGFASGWCRHELTTLIADGNLAERDRPGKFRTDQVRTYCGSRGG